MKSSFDLDYFLKQLEYIINNYIKTLPITDNEPTNSKLAQYYKELSSFLTEDELHLASSNINNVNVYHRHDSIKSILIRSGYFEFASNPLLIFYIFNHTLGHELSHLASCYHLTDSPIYLCGFSVHYKDENNKLSLGTAITEGYNELVSSRAYSIFGGTPKSYPTFVTYSRLFEIFFEDHNTLRNLYFNCDLPSLINTLSNYMKKTEAFDLILAMDTALDWQKKNHPIDSGILKNIIYYYLYNCIKDNGVQSQKERLYDLINIRMLLDYIKLFDKFHINTNLMEYLHDNHCGTLSKTLTLSTISQKISSSKKTPYIL